MNKENIHPTQTQFKYTSLWNDYINLLKSNVPLKKHRLGLKYYENTFTGADAINTFLSHLKNRPDLFPDNTNRRNISRLCSKLLEQGVLERVGVSNNNLISNPHHEFENHASFTNSLASSVNIMGNSHGNNHNYSSLNIHHNLKSHTGHHHTSSLNRISSRSNASGFYKFEDNNSALYKISHTNSTEFKGHFEDSMSL